VTASPPAPRSVPARVLAALEARPRLAVALAAVLPFLGTLGNPPVLDDGWAALDNPLVWSLRNAGRIFAELYGYAGDPSVRGPYRPVTTLTYALNYAVHGRWTPGFHAVNVALHAAASVLVLALARRLAEAAAPLRARRLALVAGLLFAVHPAHVEAVATIFGRTEPLCACFAIGALLLALDRRRAPWRLPAAVAVLALGMLSKEIAVVTPVVFLVVAWALPAAAGLDARPGLRDAGARAALLRALGVAAALGLAFLPYLAGKGTTLAVTSVARWFPVGTPPAHVALTMSRVLGEYLRILAFPSFLGGDFAYAARLPTLAAPTPGFLVATAAWAATLGAALVLLRRVPLAGAGLVWTFVGLLPVMHLVPVGVLLAERLLYFPSIGFCLAVAALLPLAASVDAVRPSTSALRAYAQGERLARWAPALVLALVAALGTRAVVRTLDWRTSVALWESELAKAPRDPVVNNNLAIAYTGRGEHAKAVERLQVALAVQPAYWRAYVNLGIARQRLGDRDRARAAFVSAVRLAPGSSAPRFFLALLLREEGDLAGAAAQLARARELAPEEARLARWHGDVLLRLGRRDDARAALERAVALDPADAEARALLASAR
jgi:protein O-mannosyl-transferase